MKIVALYWLSLLAFTFVSCKSVTNPSSLEEVVPLKIGNFWVYDVNTYDSTGTLEFSYIDTIRVAGMKVFANETWFTITNRGDTTYGISRTDGFWEKTINYGGFGSPPIEHTYFKFKFPTIAADTFGTETHYSWPVYGIEDKYFSETISQSEDVNTSMGIFHAIHYRYHIQHLDSASQSVISDSSPEDNFVTAGVGMTKRVLLLGRLVGGPANTHIEYERKEYILKNYHLN